MRFTFFKYLTAKVLVVLLLFSLKGFTQKVPSWKIGEDLYQDPDLKLKIYLKIDSNSCNQNATVFSEYKFKILEKYVNEKTANSQSKFIKFSFDYINCNNEIFTKTISVDISKTSGGEFIESKDFQFNDIKRLYSRDPSQKSFFYNPKRSDVNIQESKSKYPKPPKSISGNNQIVLGETTKLSVNGEKLSDGVKWIWLKDSCNGIRLGTGLTLDNIRPTETTTYFVYAQDEKLDYKTACVSLTVFVDTKSKDADKITGDPLICEGKTSILSVKGGKLGKGANWLWYENNINSKSIGEGEKIVVSPKKKTIYYVRAEGTENKTNPLSFEVDIAGSSNVADKIIGQEKGCTNEKLDLKIDGGKLGSKADWVWYNQSDSILGRGEVLSTNIIEGPQLIKVRAEGLCNNTDYTSITINGLTSSFVRKINSYNFEKKKTKLDVDGVLGDRAIWVWYVNSKRNTSEYKLIGKGKEIKVSSKKYRTYKVTAEQGSCDANSNATSFLTIGKQEGPKLKRKIDYVYYRVNQNLYQHKLFHLGASVGLFNQMNSIYLIDSPINNFKADSSSKFDLSSNGISWGVSFTPLIFEKHKSESKNPLSASIGFFYKGGLANFNLNNFNSNLNDTVGVFNSLKFNNVSNMSLGTEVTFGFRGFRLYYSYELENNNLNFNADFSRKGALTPDRITFNKNLNFEKNKLGFRFGRYASRNALGLYRGVTYDLYFMTINGSGNDLSFKNHYPAEGGGLSLWIQSIIKIQGEIISFSNNDTFSSIKLLFNLDLFY